MKAYQDKNQAVEVRVQDLLERMTLDEKLAQLGAQWLYLDPNGEHKFRELEMADGGIETTVQEQIKHGLGQITRPLGTHPVDAADGVKALNQLQKYLVEETRLGIPAMSHEESLVGLMAKGATLFPSSLNYGHTWNPKLIEKVGEEISNQAAQIGAKQCLAPVLDVSRDVRWGRTEETLGEDPYHVGMMATAYVKGIQGEDRQMLATLKHYVGHSFSEGARNHAPVHLGFKELNDIFLLPFEMAVKLADAGSVMPAYHDIDNESCHASKHLLTDVLREQWGFDGLVVADYGGIELLHSHHGLAQNQAQAAALAFNAGLDVELPDNTCSSKLATALEKGWITQETIDQAVSRVLSEKFKLGLFENPYTNEEGIELQSKKAQDLAYQTALESAVLLENNGILPLSTETKLAVLGATADDPLALLGGYSFPVHLILSSLTSSLDECPSLLKQIKQTFEHVSYHKGCDILTHRDAGAPVFPGDVDLAIAQDKTSPISMDKQYFDAAKAQLENAEVALVCVGDLAGLFQTGTIGEGSDADSLNLPGVQQELIDLALDSGKPVVVLVTGGRPYNLGRAEQEAAAILYGWAPGQEGARAICDLLTGKEAPSGRLTLSIPKNAGAVPYFYNHKLKSSGTPIAFHFGSKYNFGYGLTYTNFEYSDLEVAQDKVPMGGSIRVKVKVKNTGARTASEVVQLYVKDVFASLVRPIRELKGFAKVEIAPNQTKEITFDLPTDMLNFTNSAHQRMVEAGEFELMIGKSSVDIQSSKTVTVTGEDKILNKNWNMVCGVSEQSL
ncbi:MAG: glycoside hydrolase family 3 N-terminal domain-containing protein [Vibrio sp.]